MATADGSDWFRDSEVHSVLQEVGGNVLSRKSTGILTERKRNADADVSLKVNFKVPQVPKSITKKTKVILPPKIRGRSKNTEEKENEQPSSHDDDEENVEIIEKDNEIANETEATENGEVVPTPVDLSLSEKVKKRFHDDFGPKFQELRDTMMNQVEQMLLDFEENFCSYLLSVSEDSVTLLKDRYEYEEENDDDSEEDSGDGLDSDDEEPEDDENNIEEREEDEDSEHDDTVSSEEEDDDGNHSRQTSNKNSKAKMGNPSQSNSRASLSLSTSIKAKKVSYPLKTKLRSPPINKSRDSSTSRKRKPPLFDYDSTDEANLRQLQTPPTKSKQTPLPKSSQSNSSISVIETYSPKKKRKISPLTRKVVRKSGRSSTSMLSSVDCNEEDSPTTANKSVHLLSPIPLAEDVKLENISLVTRSVDHSHIMLQNNLDSNILELSSIVEGSSCMSVRNSSVANTTSESYQY